jgi:tetratricopeptide (TPR) repeat protein
MIARERSILMNNSFNLSDDDTLVKEYLERGKGLFNDGETERAFKDFNKAILINNEYAEAYFVKAQAHLEMYEVEEAEKCIMKYLKLVPGDPKAYWKLVDIHDLTGDFDRCLYYYKKLLEIYRKAIEVDCTKSAAYFGKSEVYMAMGNSISALKFAEKAYQIEPDNEWYKCYYNVLKNMI